MPQPTTKLTPEQESFVRENPQMTIKDKAKRTGLSLNTVTMFMRVNEILPSRNCQKAKPRAKIKVGYFDVDSYLKSAMI